ncbi:histidine kinase, partial [Streptomyces daliensis]|nr:histidine kinase [Streptomyces daliensis]
GAVVLWWLMLDYNHDAEARFLPGWLSAADAVLGAFACLALWARRRWPLAVALVLVPAGAVSNTAFGALMTVVLNLGLRVPWRRA